jgi:predicted RNase H-like HicB family nuclease
MDPRYRIECDHNGEEWEVRFPQLPGVVGRGVDLVDAIDAARFAQEDYLGRFAVASEWAHKYGG